MRHVTLLALPVFLALAACGGGGGGGGGGPRSDDAGGPASAELANLSVSVGPLSPAFEHGTRAYTVGPAGLLTADRVLLTPTAVDARARITVDGEAAASGQAVVVRPELDRPQPVEIEVTATDGTVATYTVAFRREAPGTVEARPGALNDYGEAVALAGDLMAVGIPDGQGSVHLLRDGVDTPEVLRPEGPSDGFGSALAFSEALLVVGAPEGEAGVYVFEPGIGGAWDQTAFWTSPAGLVDDGFGFDVDLSGEVIVVGAPYDDGVYDGSGAAYVYRRIDGEWVLEARLEAPNAGERDRFGISVAIEGDTILVGAYLEDSDATGVGGLQTDNKALDSGAVYAFVRAGNDWVAQAYLKASDTEPYALFGISVDLSGETAAVGAARAGDGGAVYLFRRSGALWVQVGRLESHNSDNGDLFGYDVALEGDVVVVGALKEDSSDRGIGTGGFDNDANGSGAAYVFSGRGALWEQVLYVKPTNTEPYMGFGWAVAVSNDRILVGSRSANAVYVLR